MSRNKKILYFCYNDLMKFWKKSLILGSLVLGILAICLGVKASKESREFERQAAEQAKVIAKKPLKFAVMADIHSDTENLQRALLKAKEDRVDFVILAGDLTSLGKKEELLEVKNILGKSGLKYFVIPGNHDLWASQKFKTNIFQEVFGKDFQSFKVAEPQNGREEIKFILVNNGGDEGIGKGESVWLKKELLECPVITCLVFMHIPLNHPTSLHIMGETNPEVASTAGEWVKLLVASQVKEVFTGHLHFSSSYEIDGLKTTVVGAITAERNFQSPKFLEVWEEKEKLAEKEIFVAN